MGIAVMTYERLPGKLDQEAWEHYRRAMEPTRADAVQRHMLTREEFNALDWNKRITKLVAFDAQNHQIVGLAMTTNHLDAYDLIEPLYFKTRWPGEFRRNAIWYVLFTTAEPGAPLTTFHELVREIIRPIREAKGVGALDWSTARVNRGMARASDLLIGRDAPLKEITQDAQNFQVYTFDWS